MIKKVLKIILLVVVIVLAVGFVLAQLVPYGRDHSNPPVIGEPNWDSPQTRELAERACFDCHSNETRWPWYTNIAPFSWLTQHDTEEGRSELNFSTWGSGGEGREPDEAIEAVSEGEMPPDMYLMVHADARLTPEERQALIEGLRATIFGQSSN
jgi:hypothetical protein